MQSEPPLFNLPPPQEVNDEMFPDGFIAEYYSRIKINKINTHLFRELFYSVVLCALPRA